VQGPAPADGEHHGSSGGRGEHERAAAAARAGGAGRSAGGGGGCGDVGGPGEEPLEHRLVRRHSRGRDVVRVDRASRPGQPRDRLEHGLALAAAGEVLGDVSRSPGSRVPSA
jgi:hypothetical protein